MLPPNELQGVKSETVILGTVNEVRDHGCSSWDGLMMLKANGCNFSLLQFFEDVTTTLARKD